MARLLKGALLCMLATSGLAAVNELSWTLDSALTQLDRQTRDFDSVLAEVSASWTAETGEPRPALNGRIYINGDGIVRVRQDSPEERTVLVGGRDVQVYDPVRALVEVFPLRGHPERWEP